MLKFSNHLTQDEALQLARRIEQYWHGREHFGVRAWIEKIPSDPGGRTASCYGVRSNLVRGMPPPVVLCESPDVVRRAD
jgi:hypothetical protein